MAARRGLVRTARARSLAALALLCGVLASARAERLTPLPRATAAPDESGRVFALTPPASVDTASPVLIDSNRGVRPPIGWGLHLAFHLDYVDLPLIPARGSGMFAFLGTSTQSLGGFRLHF